MQNLKIRKTFLQKILTAFGIDPNPQNVFILRIIIVVVSMILIIYLNKGSDSSHHGNQEALKAEYPELFQ